MGIKRTHPVGFEPTTHSLEGYCSSRTELRMLDVFKKNIAMPEGCFVFLINKTTFMGYLPLFCCCFFVAIFSTIGRFILTHTGFVLFENIAKTRRVFHFFKQDKAKQEFHFVLSEKMETLWV